MLAAKDMPYVIHLHPAQFVPLAARCFARVQNAADAKRAKVLGRFGKLIIAAVKRGGPSGNPELDQLLRQAKLAAVPKDLIERNIKKAADKSQADFVDVTYEAYGLGGVGIVCEVLTDNINRSATEVRTIITKAGAKMADPGSVMFNFERRGLVVVPAARVDEDQLLEVAMEAGAIDIVAETIVLDEALKKEMKVWNVWAPVAEYGHVKSAVEAAGMTVDADLSGLQLVPLVQVDVDDDTHEMNQAIIDKLNDLDDVDAVYCNQKD
eukprot:jgi/Mesvir1/17309/Mv07706-RA.1